VEVEQAALCPARADDAPAVPPPEPVLPSRPSELEGSTYKIKTPLTADATYVTINDLVQADGSRRPYELFINTRNLQHFSWIVAMSRLISAVLRHNPDPWFLVDELKSIYDPNGGYFSEGRYVPSLAADIGLTIEKHLRKIGLGRREAVATPGGSGPEVCPQCGERALAMQENCVHCLSCGFSKCG
jgi:ribonucleoside-diphosphate reductase alpha chain